MRRYPGEPKEPVTRYTVAEAADILGITTGAVRNRLSRGTLRSIKFAGTVYVLLPDDMSPGTERGANDTPGGTPHPEFDALISSKEETIAVLREQLEAERQANAEARRLLMAALERIPAIEPPQEATEDAETVDEEPERAAQPRPDTAGPQTAPHNPQRVTLRGLRQRIFGR